MMNKCKYYLYRIHGYLSPNHNPSYRGQKKNSQSSGLKIRNRCVHSRVPNISVGRNKSVGGKM